MRELGLLAAMEATWPAVARPACGPFTLRAGAGGGNRVSAATAEGEWSEADLDAAEAGMRALGQRPLFMLRAGEDRLDAALAARGYAVQSPVSLYAAPATSLAAPPRPMTTFPHWPMLAILRDLWAEAGIGPERIAVMERTAVPKTAILGRDADRAAACLFAACAERIAFVHALYVTPSFRRHGLARQMMAAAARWAAALGAETLALAVERDNAPAIGLYAALGMQPVAAYHYRIGARP